MNGTVRLRRRFLLLTLVALVLAGSVGSSEAFACSCAGTPSNPKEDLRTSDAVFLGKVLEVRENTSGMAGGPEPNVPVEIAVEATWKGVDEEKVVVLGGDGASCSFDFGEGERYLVYAERGGGEKDGDLGANLCGPTKRLAAAQQDLGVLGSPIAATPTSDELARTGGLHLSLPLPY